jgi:DNA gyrase subunit A
MGERRSLREFNLTENIMEVGLVRKIDIDNEMQQAYLDYAMSVIVSRALPDARDGLKPVHRRILYAMYDMGLRADSSYKKSARIVGEVLGKYHPHGDMAVYEAMARMAQDFSMRCLLVDGQGNFGSIDGDPPAAMRYTEARLEASAIDLLADINKNTVDFDPNFDDTLTEPVVLPAAIPNLLVNGATGIAVGMSTSIPPHNLGEVVDALKYMLENWEKMDDINIDDLMRFIQGPDFPTGGVILHEEGDASLASAYGSGRGRVTVQARAHLEEMERGRNRVIVTELPYMTNKASLIERIASLAREERLEGIADLRDESDRHGMRIVIELSKTADPEAVLRDLYKNTPMQGTFSIIMLALVEGEPRMLSLKAALRVYLDHRLEIIRRRSEFDLEKARQRAHVLEGLRVALKNLDEVIDLIRKAPVVESARVRLMKRFKLSEIQAQAILDMQLRRLASLERKKIELEYKDLLVRIKELEGLLRSPKKMRQVVSDELEAVKEAYGDPRRTQIVQLKEGVPKVSLLTASDLIPEKEIWLSVSTDGLISRTQDDKPPRLSGNEAPLWLLKVNTRDTLYLVCEQGEAAAISMHTVPEAEKPSDGVAIHKISALTSNAKLTALFTLPAKGERAEDWYILTVTYQGMIKKSPLGELPGPSANTFTLVRVNDGDRLGWLKLSSGQNEVILVTAEGMAIRFSEEDVRPMGLVAAGVIGIKLQEGDEVAGMDLLPQTGEVFLVATDGTAKRVSQAQFPKQGRYGQGVAAWKLPANVKVAGMTIGKGTTRLTLHLSRLAPKSVRLDDAPLQGRTARGKSIQELKEGDSISALTVPWEVERPLAGSTMPVKRASRGGTRKKKSAPSEKNGDQPVSRTTRRTAAKSSTRTTRKPGAPKTLPEGDGKPPSKTSTRRPASKSASQTESKPRSTTRKPRGTKSSTGAASKPSSKISTRRPAGKPASQMESKPKAATTRKPRGTKSSTGAASKPPAKTSTRGAASKPSSQAESKPKTSTTRKPRVTKTSPGGASKPPSKTSARRTASKSVSQTESKPKTSTTDKPRATKSSTEGASKPSSKTTRRPAGKPASQPESKPGTSTRKPPAARKPPEGASKKPHTSGSKTAKKPPAPRRGGGTKS